MGRRCGVQSAVGGDLIPAAFRRDREGVGGEGGEC